MRRGVGLFVLLACSTAWAAAPPVKGAGRFTKQEIAWLKQARQDVPAHAEAGRFAEAEKVVKQALELCERTLGRDHWQTTGVRLELERWQRLLQVPARRHAELGRSLALSHQGRQL